MANILLIDDEEMVRETIGLALTGAGHIVSCASDGLEGLRLMQELQPDLVITDIVMPNQEGLETIIALHKADVAIPIIAISGGGGVDFLRAAEVFGASKILRKPFRTAALLAMVNECLTTNPA